MDGSATRDWPSLRGRDAGQSTMPHLADYSERTSGRQLATIGEERQSGRVPVFSANDLHANGRPSPKKWSSPRNLARAEPLWADSGATSCKTGPAEVLIYINKRTGFVSAESCEMVGWVERSEPHQQELFRGSPATPQDEQKCVSASRFYTITCVKENRRNLWEFHPNLPSFQPVYCHLLPRYQPVDRPDRRGGRNRCRRSDAGDGVASDRQPMATGQGD